MPQIALCALVHLLQVARSVTSARAYAKAPPRTYAPWGPEETELLRGLLDHGVSQVNIAKLLLRTENAINHQLERETNPRHLPHYPATEVRLCDADLQLLQAVPGKTSPLLWDYADALPDTYTAAGFGRNIRIIEVAPDPLLRKWRSAMLGDEDPRHWHWAIYRNDADIAVQGVWADLARTLMGQQGAKILIRPPDKHHKRRTALRTMLKRMSAAALPRNVVLTPGGKYGDGEIALLDDAQSWTPVEVSKVRAQTIIAVLPALGGKGELEVEVRETTSPLPHLIRDSATRAKELGHRQWWLEQVSADRWDEHLKYVGLGNTGGEPLALEWRALSSLPPLGTLWLPDELALTQAAVWYALTRASVPKGTAGVLQPLSGVVEAEQWHREAGGTLTNPVERLRQRMLLDLPKLPTQVSSLRMIARAGP